MHNSPIHESFTEFWFFCFFCLLKKTREEGQWQWGGIGFFLDQCNPKNHFFLPQSFFLVLRAMFKCFRSWTLNRRSELKIDFVFRLSAQNQQSQGTQDYYTLLDVPKDAGDGAIRKAYKKACLKWHPGVQLGGSPGACILTRLLFPPSPRWSQMTDVMTECIDK